MWNSKQKVQQIRHGAQRFSRQFTADIVQRAVDRPVFCELTSEIIIRPQAFKVAQKLMLWC